MKVRRDAVQSVNFSLKVMDSSEWSFKHDFGINENINTQSFTDISQQNFEGFSADNFDIVDYRPTENMHHIMMTDQV